MKNLTYVEPAPLLFYYWGLLAQEGEGFFRVDRLLSILEEASSGSRTVQKVICRPIPALIFALI
jgi:hypothetical protein